MRARLFALLLCVFLLLTSREPPWADAHVAYATAQALVDRGRLDVQLNAPPSFFTFHAGKKYGFAALGNALALVPSYLVYKALARLTNLPREALCALTVHLSPALLMAGACVLFYQLCRRRDASQRWALLLSFVMGLSTICLCYARSPYSEALQTMAVLLLLDRTLAAERRLTPRNMAWLGAAAGILVNAKLVYAAILPFPLIYLLHRSLRSPAGHRGHLLLGCLSGLLGFLPFAGLVLLHNYVKTGSPLRTGYDSQGDLFTNDLLSALYGYTLSSGKSIFLYSPPLVLGLCGLAEAWRRRRAETLLILALLIVPAIISARHRSWHGDYAWGPRYMAPLSPLLLLCALPWLPQALARTRAHGRRLGLALLLALGLSVQVLGCAFYWDHYIRILITVREQGAMTGWSTESLPYGYFIPEFSPVRGHLWMLQHVVRRDPDLARDAPWRRLVTPRIDLSAHWPRLRVDWWGLDWLTGTGRVRATGLILLGLYVGGILLSGRGLLQRLRQSPGPPSTRS